MRNIAVAGLLALSATAFAATHKPVTVKLQDAQGATVGKVVFTQAANVVSMRVSLKGLPAGEHGIHVHANGTCTAPDFTSAGGHLNPDNKHHGFANPMGHHAGDFAMSVAVKDNGTGMATLRSTDLSLDPSAADSIYGKAVVVHADADDQKSDPAGNSGKRIACGVIPAK
jgi:superoxide dismutase, Cu-Zn family